MPAINVKLLLVLPNDAKRIAEADKMPIATDFDIKIKELSKSMFAAGVEDACKKDDLPFIVAVIKKDMLNVVPADKLRSLSTNAAVSEAIKALLFFYGTPSAEEEHKMLAAASKQPKPAQAPLAAAAAARASLPAVKAPPSKKDILREASIRLREARIAKAESTAEQAKIKGKLPADLFAEAMKTENYYLIYTINRVYGLDKIDRTALGKAYLSQKCIPPHIRQLIGLYLISAKG